MSARGLVALFLSLPLLAAADPAENEHGRAVYNFRCYFCHGYSGNARTLAEGMKQNGYRLPCC